MGMYRLRKKLERVKLWLADRCMPSGLEQEVCVPAGMP